MNMVIEAIILVLVASSASLGIVLAARILPRLSAVREDLGVVQAMHTRRTPRLGGVAIFGASSLAFLFAPEYLRRDLVLFNLAAGILFAAGLAEDLGIRISPRARLLASLLASVTVVMLLGVWLPRLDIPHVDAAMANWIVGVPVTLLVTAGIVNGFNLVDGVNGLASLAGIAAAVALALISRAGGHGATDALGMMVAAGVVGFLLVNYPFGLIFLGDAGAYTLGFVLSWLGIAVLIHVPEATAWAILLALFWPAADALVAILRRLRLRRTAMAPDRMHMHHLVLRGLEICLLGRGRRNLANPLTTVVMSPLVILPPVAGVLLWNNPVGAFLAVLAFVALTLCLYIGAMVLIRRNRLRPTILVAEPHGEPA